MAALLTERQREVYQALRDEYHRTGGWPVSVRVLADALGVQSTSGVHYRLRVLIEKGLVEISPTGIGYRPKE